jgi:hypothetical protein
MWGLEDLEARRTRKFFRAIFILSKLFEIRTSGDKQFFV